MYLISTFLTALTLISTTAIAGELIYAEPSLVNPETIIVKSSSDASPFELDTSKDYIIKCDPAKGGVITRRALSITGGHNIVMKGCVLNRELNTPKSVYPPLKDRSGDFVLEDGKRVCPGVANPAGTLRISGHTGIAYVEGVIINHRNSVYNYNNYGADAINVGDSDALATIKVAGKQRVGSQINIRFYNPKSRRLPLTISHKVKSIDTSSVASGIAAAINGNADLRASGVSARAKDQTVTLKQPMPIGRFTVMSETLNGEDPSARLIFNNSGKNFSAVNYISQNVRAENVWSTSCGNHGDGIQSQGSVNKLYLSNFTITSGYQGVQLQPANTIGDARLTQVNTRYLDRDYSKKNSSGDSVGANGYTFWLGTGMNVSTCLDCEFNYRLKNVYAEKRDNLFGDDSNGDNSPWETYSVAPANNMRFGNEPVNGDPNKVSIPPQPLVSIEGYVTRGTPPGGDFVPRSLIANGSRVTYISPK